MTATTVLILSGNLRAAAMTTQIATVALTAAPPGVTTTLAENLNALPFYNQDLDTDDPPTAVTTLRQTWIASRLVAVVTRTPA